MSSWIDPQNIIFFGSAFLVTFTIAIFICMKAITTPHPIIKRHKEEEYFYNPKTKERERFPSIDSDPQIDFSIIVPAYDEEKRLPLMLDEAIAFLNKKNCTYEVIVVSDGSRDATVAVAQKYSEIHGSNKIRVLELIENRGKGGAVRLGMQSSRGKYLLFADADGATKFGDFIKLEAEMKEQWNEDGIVIGSRAHLEDDAIATRSFFRTILMHGFHLLVWLFAVRGVRDTQCGFKLFTRHAARVLFLTMHVERWAFDVEVLFIAQALRMPIREVAVNWTEIDGSKVTPFWSWLQMGRDLFLIWFRYTIGAWSLQRKQHRQ